MFPQSRHVAPKSRRDAVADEISVNFNLLVNPYNIQPPHRLSKPSTSTLGLVLNIPV